MTSFFVRFNKHIGMEQFSNVVELRAEQAPRVTLRRASAEDFEQLKKLNLTALELDPGAFGALALKRKEWADEDWQHYLAQEQIHIGTARSGEIVAMAGAKNKGEGVWQLHSVYVDQAHRKDVDAKERRLAERLVTELVANLREKERAVRVDLIVSQEKPAAVKLYEKLGFVTTDVLHDHPSADGETHDKFVMSKDLQEEEEEALPLAA